MKIRFFFRILLLCSGLIFSSGTSLFAQYSTTVDTLNCQDGTVTFVVDLSSDADSLWQSPEQERFGDCCGAADDNCVQFALTLAPGAQGINFLIPDGCGAVAGGSTNYQVDCGPLTPIGVPLCLNGSGPFVITFCKPGGNENCYSIQSLPSPASGGDVLTADGCVDTLSVVGLDPATIVWNSLTPDAEGDYNGLLNNLAGSNPGTNNVDYTGEETVTVTPGAGSPSFIEYEVCGSVLGFCSAAAFCDTVSVSIFPTLFAEILPADPAVCAGGSPTTITANPLGGTAPYTFVWTTAVDPALNGATSQSIDVTIPGEYSVVIGDATGCPFGYDTVIVSEFNNDITVDAGLDIILCQDPIPTFSLLGLSPVTNAGHWANATGTFSTSNTDLIVDYTPSPAEIAAGFAELILIADDTLTCPGDQDTILLNLPDFASTLSIAPTHVTCNADDDGSLNLTVTGGNAPFTFDWDIDGNGDFDDLEDVSSLAPATYQVIVQDVNGCLDTTSALITEPDILEVIDTLFSLFPDGNNIQCFNGANGSIDIRPAGGTLPYSYTWTTADGSGLVVSDKDQTGLSAGTYVVTIEDGNNCVIVETYTLTEPTQITAANTPATYPSGDNISCFGENDGSIDLTIGAGSPGYTYAWTTVDGSGLTATDEDQSALTAGTYNVTATDINGCTIDQVVVLTEPTQITAGNTPVTYPSGDNISCFGENDGSIDLTIGAGSPGYTYAWTTADGSGLTATDEDQTGLTAGTYNVTATDINGCTIDQVVVLTEPTQITAVNTPVTYPSGDNISCFGENDGSIDLTIGAGSPGYTYAWTTADGSGLTATDEDQSALTAGTYNVTATDINGCTIDQVVVLTEPTQITAGNTPATYPSGDNISCFGENDGSIDLTIGAGSPGYTYAWTTADGSGLTATDEDQSALTAGTYNVTATDINGCTIDQVVVLTEPTQITAANTPATYPSGDNISCFGENDGSIDLTIGAGSPGYTYAWTTADGSGLTATDEDQSALTAGSYNVTATDINGCTIDQVVVLTEPTQITAGNTPATYPSGDNISCFGENDGSIDLTIGAGSPGYTYAWTTADGSGLTATDEDQSALTAGTYNVTATDINGCTIDQVVVLTEPTQITAANTPATYPSGDNISCFGENDGSIDLTIGAGSPGYTYAWTTADGSGLTATDEDQSALTAGTYNVTATDINGCTIDQVVVLTEPTQITAANTPATYPSGDNISCFGENDGSIDLTIGAGSPGYTYAWTTADGSGLTATDEDQSALTAGTYNVTATDINGCTIDQVVVLTEPTQITAGNTPVTYPSGDNISCFGENDGSIDLTIGAGSPGYTYAWTTADGSGLTATDEDQSALTAGTYNVTATDINGCTIDQVVVLTEPTQITAGNTPVTYPSGDNISCFGENDGSIDLTIGAGSPGYTYAWTTADGSGLTATDEDQSALTAGTYNVTATDINGCTIDQVVVLTEPTQITAGNTPVTYPSGDNISCFGENDGSIDLTIGAGSPGYTYAWTTADGSGLTATDEDQSALTAGTYNVTATDINGCTIDQVVVLTEPTQITAGNTPVTYPSGDNISCFGENDGAIDLTIGAGSPGYTYAWTTADGSGLTATDEDQTGLSAGTYSVTATDINGCTISDNVLLIQPPVLLESNTVSIYPSGDNISCFGENDGAIDLTIGAGSPGYTYAWTTADGSGLTATDEDQSALTAGTYNVTATDINGCTIDQVVVLTEPTQITAGNTPVTYPSGDNISCFGENDGAIDLTIGAGSPGYTYAWTTADGSGLTATDEDQSALTAGTYNVTATDINGCTIDQVVVLTEPTQITAGNTPATYPSGDNISCFGENDGSIDLTIGAGSPGYTYAWTTADGSGLTATDEDQSALTAGTYNVTATDINGCTIDQVVVLTEPTQITAANAPATYPSGDNISCFGENDGSIDLTIGAGSPGYTYAWTTADGSGLTATDEDQSALTAGTYNVTATDINGCTIDQVVVLTEPTQITAGNTPATYPSGDNISCFGENDGSIDLTIGAGSPGYTYAWTTADGSGLTATDEDQSALTAGTYNVTATDINGCTIDQVVVLTEPTQITAGNTPATYPSGDNISCFGENDGSIDLTIGAGSPGYTYAWTTADGSGLTATDEDQSALTAGTYNVTATDINGCTIDQVVVLTEPTQITAGNTPATYPSGDNISCFGENDGSIDLTIGAGSPGYTYAWTTADGSGLTATDEDQSALTAGTYNVTATDINGCTIDQVVVLTEPTQITAANTPATYPSGDNISCFGENDGSIDLTIGAGSPGYTYAWTTADGSGLTATDEDQSALTAGTYNVTATDINGCTIDQVVVLTEPTQITAANTPATYPSGDNISCFGENDGSIDLTIGAGSPGYTYAWTTADGSGLTATDEDQSALTAGTYNVTATDINGCTIDQVVVLTEPTQITAGNTPVTYPSGDNISCFGENDGSIDLTIGAGSPGYTYAWTTADGSGLTATDEDQSALTAGTYNVTATDINGCTIDQVVVLTEPTQITAGNTPVTYPSGDNISCFGENDGSIDLTIGAGSPGYTYAWTTADGSGLTATDEDQSALTAGTYNVTATDINGCTIDQVVVLTEPTQITAGNTPVTYPSGDNISCFGENDGSIDLTIGAGSPGYTYAWTTADGSGLTATDEDQSALTAGTYNVTATDINGCTIDQVVVLTEPDVLNSLMAPTTYAGGFHLTGCNNDGAIDLTIGAGSPGYTYAWTTADGSGLTATDEDQTGLSAGTYSVTATDINGCTISDNVLLIQPPVLLESNTVSIYPSGDNISCFGFNDGSIDLTIDGGTPGYTYAWTTVDGSGLTATDEDQSALTAGTYNVTATDINGCTIDQVVVLTEPTQITAGNTPATYPSGDNISCFGENDGSIDLTIGAGSPGYTYAWTTADGSGLTATDEDQSALTAGTYNVTATDINGCTIDQVVVLTEPTQITAGNTPATYPSGDNISCFGENDGSIDLTIGAGSPGYTYAWTTADGSGLTATDEDQSALTAGTYNVTATDINGCTIDQVVVLTEPTQITAGNTPVTYPSGDNISCFGENDGSIDLTIGAGSPGYTYAWTTADGSGLTATDEDQSALTAGTYNVTATDINGCTIDQVVVLTEPTQITAGNTPVTYPSGDNISCFGENDGSIDLTIGAGSPGYTYAWTTADGSGLTATDEDQTGLTAGTYNVTATDINGCTIDQVVVLTEPTQITAGNTPVTYPSGDNISCFGENDGSIDLTIGAGSPGYTYAWTTADGSGLTATDEDQSGLTAGTYNVTATDINGCTIDQVVVLTEPTQITAGNTPVTYPSGDNISCFGENDGSIDLTIGAGSPGYTYAWTTADGSGLTATDEDQTGLTAGTYNVTATDINGCTIDQVVVLTEPTQITAANTPATYPSGDNISCFGENDGSIDLTIGAGSPGYTYAWTTADGSGLTATDEDQSALTAGTYNVTATDINGCTIDQVVVLTEPDTLTSLLTPSLVAGGYNVSGCINDGTIDLVLNGGSAPYIFDWDNDGIGDNDDDEDLANLDSGDFGVTITDVNGCVETSSITLTEPNGLAVNLFFSDQYPSGDNISCFGLTDGSINLEINGGVLPIIYDWDNDGIGDNDDTPNLIGLSEGTYSLHAEDQNGCFLDTTITLTEPTPLQQSATVSMYAGDYNISCNGFTDGSIDYTVTGGSPIYSYDWSNDGISDFDDPQDLNNVGAGNYMVTALDVNSCKIDTIITLTEPPVLSVNININTDYFGLPVSCVGQEDGEIEAIVTGGTPNYSYSWGNDININPILSNLGVGEYTIDIVDANGCITQATVILDGNPLPIVNPVDSQTLCLGETPLIQSNSGPTDDCVWTLSNGMVLNGCGPFEPTIEEIGCIDANLVVTSNLGCIDSLNMLDYICVNPLPEASFYQEDQNLDIYHTGSFFINESEGATDYEWYFSDGSVYESVDVYHQFPYENATTYDVILYAITEHGCLDSASIEVEIENKLVFFIPNTFTPDEDAFNQVFIPVLASGYNPNRYTFQIFNRWGEIIFDSNDFNRGWDGRYKNKQCQDGTYVWKLLLGTEDSPEVQEFHGHVNLLR